MITVVAGQVFIEYETKIDSSNQITQGYESYNGDSKINKNIVHKIRGDNLKEGTCSEKDEIYKK